MYQSTHTGAQVDEAIDKALNPDATPTASSTNLVQSGGVYDAVLGYGLGGNGKYLSASVNINDIVESGFYYWGNAPTNAPFDYGNMVVAASPARVVQHIVSTQNGGIVVRTLYNSVWSNRPIGSNRNLLDNPWFRINQRGATSGTQSQPYIADRWRVSYGSGGVTYSRTDDTVTIQSTSGSSHADLVQTLETSLSSALDGKTVTFSVMLNDYSILSTTFVFTKSTNVGKTLGVGLDGGIIGVTWVASNNWIYVQKNNTAETFRAFKLELGSVSTLANDAPPNYAEELAKCQRYCYVIKAPAATNLTLYAANAYDANNVYAGFAVPPQMRTPTLSLSSSSAIKCGTSSFTITPSSVSVYGYAAGIATILIAATSSFSAGTTYRVGLIAGESIIFSADL